MNMRKANWLTVFCCGIGLILMGCNNQEETTKTFDEAGQEDTAMDEHDHDHDHGHEHPTEGPHHGSLIELGKEAYHGELVHDEKTGAVTVYVLDGAAKKSVPIKAESIMVNVKHDGKGDQFTLTAAPEESDPMGQSSRFVIKDKALGELLDGEDVTARLVLEIDGKSYTGDIAAHDHDHDHDHGHEHGEEKHAH